MGDPDYKQPTNQPTKAQVPQRRGRARRQEIKTQKQGREKVSNCEKQFATKNKRGNHGEKWKTLTTDEEEDDENDGDDDDENNVNDDDVDIHDGTKAATTTTTTAATTTT